jgi:hypothetical protein
VLLNLYRYTPESRDNLIKVFQAIKDRIWLPHQVALEYQRRRIDVLLGQLNFVGKLETLIDNPITELDKLRRSSSLFAVNELIDPISKDLEAIKANLQEKKQEKPDLMTGDPIFDAVTELFDPRWEARTSRRSTGTSTRKARSDTMPKSLQGTWTGATSPTTRTSTATLCFGFNSWTTPRARSVRSSS